MPTFIGTKFFIFAFVLILAHNCKSNISYIIPDLNWTIKWNFHFSLFAIAFLLYITKLKQNFGKIQFLNCNLSRRDDTGTQNRRNQQQFFLPLLALLTCCLLMYSLGIRERDRSRFPSRSLQVSSCVTCVMGMRCVAAVSVPGYKFTNFQCEGLSECEWG